MITFWHPVCLTSLSSLLLLCLTYISSLFLLCLTYISSLLLLCLTLLSFWNSFCEVRSMSSPFLNCSDILECTFTSSCWGCRSPRSLGLWSRSHSRAHLWKKFLVSEGDLLLLVVVRTCSHDSMFNLAKSAKLAQSVKSKKNVMFEMFTYFCICLSAFPSKDMYNSKTKKMELNSLISV